MAVPPFDDLHVRKAVSLAVDKQALRAATRRGLGGRIAGHIVPDAMLDNLLVDYDPYATPGHRGDVAGGPPEMAMSRYDRDRDGRCDAAVCRGVPGARASRRSGHRGARRDRPRNLRPIGIELKVKTFDPDTYFGRLLQPEAQVPLIPSLGYGADTLNASGLLPALFHGPTIRAQGGQNLSLVGATPRELRRWGYRATRVPNVDAKIGECLRLTGRAQRECWAETDQLLMEEVVPLVPYLFEGRAQVVSDRVARFAFAQSSQVMMPAFDQIALKPDPDGD